MPVEELFIAGAGGDAELGEDLTDQSSVGGAAEVEFGKISPPSMLRKSIHKGQTQSLDTSSAGIEHGSIDVKQQKPGGAIQGWREFEL